MIQYRPYLALVFFLILALWVEAQPTRPIHTVLSFLNIGPDARAASLGDGGVAASPDAYSTYWNVAKMPFNQAKATAGVSYVPWLPNLVNDMFLGYATGQYRVDSLQTFGISIAHFDYGNFDINNARGDYVEQFNSYESALTLSYARKLAINLGIGLSAKYIRSDLPGKFALLEDLQIGHAWAFDFGLYYQHPVSFFKHRSSLMLGMQLSNLGPKISYDHGVTESFLPASIRLGAALKTEMANNHMLEFLVGFSKLLVPTPPIYSATGDSLFLLGGKDPDRPLLAGIFGSFSDAPNGFKEELQEITISTGLQYGFRDRFFLRLGYHFEHREKSDLDYFTTGIGLVYQDLNIDFSYLIPTRMNHPLAHTLRVSVAYVFNL